MTFNGQRGHAFRAVLSVAVFLAACWTIGAANSNAAPDTVEVCPLSDLSADDCAGRLQFELGGAISPAKLPEGKWVPVALEIQGTVGTERGGHPPALREAVIEIDRNLRIDVAGLPVCKRRLLGVRSDALARRRCRRAIVGNGLARVGYAGTAKVIRAPLTFFNGGISEGMTRIFVHSSIAGPDSTPWLSTIRIDGDRSGQRAVWTLPRFGDAGGSLLDFKFRLKRRQSNATGSYLTAKCDKGNLKIEMPKITFLNDTHLPGRSPREILKGGLVVPCT
jgi:hypothetical protein